LSKHKQDAEMLILPGIEGDFGVLKGHTHFITAIEPGTLRVKYECNDKFLEVGFGLVSVTPNKVTIITEELKHVM